MGPPDVAVFGTGGDDDTIQKITTETIGAVRDVVDATISNLYDRAATQARGTKSLVGGVNERLNQTVAGSIGAAKVGVESATSRLAGQVQAQLSAAQSYLSIAANPQPLGQLPGATTQVANPYCKVAGPPWYTATGYTASSPREAAEKGWVITGYIPPCPPAIKCVWELRQTSSCLVWLMDITQPGSTIGARVAGRFPAINDADCWMSVNNPDWIPETSKIGQRSYYNSAMAVCVPSGPPVIIPPPVPSPMPVPGPIPPVIKPPPPNGQIVPPPPPPCPPPVVQCNCPKCDTVVNVVVDPQIINQILNNWTGPLPGVTTQYGPRLTVHDDGSWSLETDPALLPQFYSGIPEDIELIDYEWDTEEGAGSVDLVTATVPSSVPTGDDWSDEET